MLVRFLLLLLLVPVAELAVLAWLGRHAGFGATLGVMLATGLLGAVIARRQGLKVWRGVRTELAAGRLPAGEAVDGLLVLVAAALLMAPGLISDAAGLLLLIPAVRRVVRAVVFARLARSVGRRVRGFRTASGGGEVFEAEFRRADAARVEDRSAP